MNPIFALADRHLSDCRREFGHQAAIEAEVVPSLEAMDSKLAEAAVTTIRSASIESVYTGMERVLKEVASVLDEPETGGDGWHARLLAQVASGTDVRGAVIGDETYRRLDELRAFRHVEPNVYKHVLRASDVNRNLELLKSTFPVFEAEVRTFLDGYGNDVEDEPDDEPDAPGPRL